MGSNSDGQLGVGRNPEWTSVPIQINGDGDGDFEKLQELIFDFFLYHTMNMYHRNWGPSCPAGSRDSA